MFNLTLCLIEIKIFLDASRKKTRLRLYIFGDFAYSLNNMKTGKTLKIQHGNKQCQALDKSRNYTIITITHFPKNTSVFANHFYICIVYIIPKHNLTFL